MGPRPGQGAREQKSYGGQYGGGSGGGHMFHPQHQGGNMGGHGGWNQPPANRGNIDMPNLQALGITGQGTGGQGGGQNIQNPLGMGTLNLSAMPMTPALVAAALNQAGWGLISNLQGGHQQGAPSQGDGNAPQFSNQGGPGFGGGPQQGGATAGATFLNWMNQGAGSGDQQGPPVAGGSNGPAQQPNWAQNPKPEPKFLNYN